MEGFFQAGSFFDETELKELLLRRYHSLDFIKDFSPEGFIEFVCLAQKKEKEDRIYQQWCAMLPTFSRWIEFGEFREMMTGENIDLRPADEIINEIKTLHGMEEF